MKKLIILCDGGLGNRLGSLIGGLLVSDELNRTPVVCWPKNTWCGASFNDLFDTDLELLELNINDLFEKYKQNKFLIHENQTKINISYQIPIVENIKNFKIFEDEYVIYYNSLIPNFYNQDLIINKLKSLKIKESIKTKIKDICVNNNIDKNTLGIHFRKTDFKIFLDENKVENFISTNKNTKFFICSDDKNTEIKFSKYENVFINEKTHYAEKLNVDIGWNDNIIDNEGRIFDFNIKRSKESVLEGFIDMLILSKTTIITESISTFLNFSKLFGKYNI